MYICTCYMRISFYFMYAIFHIALQRDKKDEWLVLRLFVISKINLLFVKVIYINEFKLLYYWKVVVNKKKKKKKKMRKLHNYPCVCIVCENLCENIISLSHYIEYSFRLKTIWTIYITYFDHIFLLIYKSNLFFLQ
jgi:hypothetical protein